MGSKIHYLLLGMALTLFLKRSHLGRNQRRNGKCPGPVLQTQGHWRVRCSCKLSGGTGCKKCITQFGEASLLTSVIMKREGQIKSISIHTQGKSSLKSSRNEGLSRMIVYIYIFWGEEMIWFNVIQACQVFYSKFIATATDCKRLGPLPIDIL